MPAWIYSSASRTINIHAINTRDNGAHIHLSQNSSKAQPESATPLSSSCAAQSRHCAVGQYPKSHQIVGRGIAVKPAYPHRLDWHPLKQFQYFPVSVLPGNKQDEPDCQYSRICGTHEHRLLTFRHAGPAHPGRDPIPELKSPYMASKRSTILKRPSLPNRPKRPMRSAVDANNTRQSCALKWHMAQILPLSQP